MAVAHLEVLAVAHLEVLAVAHLEVLAVADLEVWGAEAAVSAAGEAETRNRCGR
jgi:hypothetical protein